MEEKKVLFFEATENGEPIMVQEPVEENVYGKVVGTLLGIKRGIVTKYGVDYHMAFVEEPDFFEKTQKITFEGKQDDFVYFLQIRSDILVIDNKLDAEHVKKAINDGEAVFDLLWYAINDANVTDDPGIIKLNGKLVYLLKLTDEITLQIIAESKKGSLDCIDDMMELCHLVEAGKYVLRAI